MGFKNAGSVYAIIKGTQEQQLGTAVEDYRTTELARLDALQDALWPAAMRGDVLAVEATLTVIESPMRLRGHDLSPRGLAPDLGQHTREVLVELGLSESEVQALVADGTASGGQGEDASTGA